MLLKILHICLASGIPIPFCELRRPEGAKGRRGRYGQDCPENRNTVNTLTEMCSRPLVTDAPAFGQKMGVTEPSRQKWLHSNPMYLSYPKLVSDSHIFLAPNSTRKAQHTALHLLYAGKLLGEKQPGQLRGNHSGWYSKWLQLCQAESK